MRALWKWCPSCVIDSKTEVLCPSLMIPWNYFQENVTVVLFMVILVYEVTWEIRNIARKPIYRLILYQETFCSLLQSYGQKIKDRNMRSFPSFEFIFRKKMLKVLMLYIEEILICCSIKYFKGIINACCMQKVLKAVYEEHFLIGVANPFFPF